jgi:predicted phage terminase large subunit-like protein
LTRAAPSPLRHDGLRPIPFKPEGDKVVRMSAQSAKIEAGYVWLPERSAWLDDFRAEVLQFPAGRYDDQVDSLSQFLAWHENNQHPQRGMLKLTGY